MRYTEVHYFEVGYRDLEEEIKERYNVELELVACEEWHNDTDHSYNNLTGEIKSYDQDIYDDVMNGQTSYGTTRFYLQRLIKDGHFPPGNYLVRVCW